MNGDKGRDRAFQTHVVKKKWSKDKKKPGKGSWVANKEKGRDDDKPEFSSKKGGGIVNHKGKKTGQDKKGV